MNISKLIVVEVFNIKPDEVIVTARCRNCGDFLFLRVPSNPAINFNDILEVIELKGMEKVYLLRGNSRLRFCLHPIAIPDALISALIFERS